NTSQATTMTYDGYGRLSTQHRPEQDAGQSTRYTYDNPDDMVKTMTDGRGSVTTYTYNGRHLVTNIQYTASAGVTDTPSVSYAYDAAGNRTQMTDGLGTVSYHYNQLSRLDSETRAFNDPGPPYLHASYTLTYGYNLAGALL